MVDLMKGGGGQGRVKRRLRRRGYRVGAGASTLAERDGRSDATTGRARRRPNKKENGAVQQSWDELAGRCKLRRATTKESLDRDLLTHV
jgi:hypothetical protein